MGVWGSGFGYVSSTNEYKVVRIIFETETETEFMFENDTEFMEVHAYTLGSGKGWRNLGNFNLGTREYLGAGIFFNGVLYWLNNQSKMIFPFDLAEEKFCENLSPPPSPPEYEFDYDSNLWVLDGCLSFVISGHVNEAECSDVWLLRNKDDNHGMIQQVGHQSIGWSEVFRLFDIEIFAVIKSYSVLTYKGNHINIHDPKASTSETIVVFEENIGVVFPHKNTFVSLKELGEEDTKRMESVEIEETEGHAQPFNQL
ncbi:uncharacterized protein LOC113284024 [Papaver somniferum]|uniref:uncharacterized protein LOC113284024 n=1 Tax=Papaver somniferum TaxID=3469 RepID=UPI000E6FF2DB|nr:uncharacterized protein LOC113284024 [Papaver somniferum]